MARQASLLSVEEARSRILEPIRTLPAEEVALDDALGRTLAEAITAPISVPPFANSSMDGFALLSSDTAGATAETPTRLRVVAAIPAGSGDGAEVRSGECARIMTGAPLPAGADAVIPFEEIVETEQGIAVSAPVSRAACIRPAGNDFREGQPLLQAGDEMTSRHIALLAAIGRAKVSVSRRPIVAILSTGDELVRPGETLKHGQIYNSNSPMLSAAVREAGGVPSVLPTARDEAEAIASAVRSASGADLLLTSGGASVGDFDHVKDVVGAAGDLAFWRVRVRPGKPLLFGTVGGLPVIGLPGNPTSAMVTFEEFVRPAIRSMLGAPPLRPEIEATLDDRVDNHGGRRTFVRVRLSYREGRFHASLTGPQDSGMLAPLAAADGLLIAPEDRDELLPGETSTVQVWRLPAGSESGNS